MHGVLVKSCAVLIALCSTRVTSTTLLRRTNQGFDRKTGLPDSSRDKYGCMACTYMYAFIDGDENLYPDPNEMDVSVRQEFSLERKNFVENMLSDLGNQCSNIQGLPDRHKTGSCRNLVRDFFNDPVNVALCVSNTARNPGQAYYCGCAVGGGMPDRGKPKRCPSTMDLLAPTSASVSDPLNPSSALVPDPERKTVRERLPAVDKAGFTGTANDFKKCNACMKIVVTDGLEDTLFLKGRFSTTKERAAFSMARRRFLLAMHPRDFCENPDSDSAEPCVNVVNDLSDTAKTAQCIGELQRNSEDASVFCACIARGRTRPGFTCPSAD